MPVDDKAAARFIGRRLHGLRQRRVVRVIIGFQWYNVMGLEGRNDPVKRFAAPGFSSQSEKAALPFRRD